MSLLKLFSSTLIVLATVGAASAATIQNSRGTYIQDRNGIWHQYVRVAGNVYADERQYRYQQPVLDIAKGSGTW
jgi:hypothetical protein